MVPNLLIRKPKFIPNKDLLKSVRQIGIDLALGLVPKAKVWILRFPRLEKAHPREQQAWTEPYLKASDPCIRRLMTYLRALPGNKACMAHLGGLSLPQQADVRHRDQRTPYISYPAPP